MTSDSGPRNAFIMNSGLLDNPLPVTCRGINVSVAGNVKVRMTGANGIAGGDNIVLYVVQGMNAMHIDKIYTTGTTATVLALLF